MNIPRRVRLIPAFSLQFIRPQLLSVLLLPVLVAGAEPLQHPRLFLNPDRLLTIRQGLENPESHFAQAFTTLKTRVDAGDLKQFDVTNTNWNYARSYLAQAAAFCYQVTGEPRYAELAFQTLREVHENPGPDQRLPESGNSALSRATVGLGFALAYDWCHDAWTREQRAYVLGKIQTALVMWEGFSHRNLGQDRKSNWVAVCRGGELLMILGAGLESEMAERARFLRKELRTHIENGYDQIGASQEGSGYMAYGGLFLLPAALADRDAGNSELWDLLVAERHFHKKMMYAGSFASVSEPGVLAGLKMFPASGVGGPNLNDEGFASLVLGIVPEADMPEVLWWYDRHMGRFAVPRDEPRRHYEPRRQGTIWSLIFYPEHVKARDPGKNGEVLVTGDQGRHYFRNRWRDPQDVLVAVHAGTKWLTAAWAQREVGLFSIVAYGTHFFGGPRRERDGMYYSKFLVDGQAGSERDLGEVRRLDTFDRGAYLVIDGGAQYENLGLIDYQRHVFLQYGTAAENNAVMVILDRADAWRNHLHTWNARLGVEERLGNWGITAETGHENGMATFTLRGQSGGTLKGWVLRPADAEIHIEDGRLYFEEKAASSEFLVAMSLEPEAPAPMNILHQGPGGLVFTVGKTKVGYDRGQANLAFHDAVDDLDVRANLPLAVRGLHARTVSDHAVHLQWFRGPLNAETLRVERKQAGADAYEAIAELPPETYTFLADGLHPKTDYRFRVVTETGGTRREDTGTATATTWDPGYAVHVDDFSRRQGANQSLGAWQTRNQDRGWILSGEEGSGRNAKQTEGMMVTSGRSRIHKTNIFFTEEFQADLSGRSAAVEADFQTQGTTEFGLILKLADGRWIRSAGMAHIASKNRWETRRWNIAEIDNWVWVNPDEFSTGGAARPGEKELADIRGLGFWAHWPLNERWARVDQLHLYARNFRRSSKE